MTDYAEFRIRIARGSTPRTYRVEATGLGGEQEGRFRMPFPPMELENFVLRVGGTRRGVRRINSPEYDLAKAFGQRLFRAVMTDKVGELYRSALAEARVERKGLRITLSLTEVPELATIPWEYLYDDPDFLAISAWTPVVRYLELPKPRRPLETTLPLRILAVVSSPTDFEPIDTADERRKLETALKPLIDANAVAVDFLEKPSLLALARALRSDRYHILHFIGHGGFDDSSQEGALLFEDESGKGRLVSGDQLGAIIRDKLSLRLVVLNSCEGARSGPKDPFSGVATSLVEREIPAVIGMQFEITDRAARLFAGEFYAMLAEGQPVDAAIAEARLAIFADQNDVEWGTPVLFMRVADGRLFNVVNATPVPRPPLPAPPPIEEVAPPEIVAPPEDLERPPEVAETQPAELPTPEPAPPTEPAMSPAASAASDPTLPTALGATRSMPAAPPLKAAGPVDVAAATAIPARVVDIEREPERPAGPTDGPGVSTIPRTRGRRSLYLRILVGAVAVSMVVLVAGLILPKDNGSSAPSSTSSPASSPASSAGVVPIVAGIPDPRSILFDSTYNDDVGRIADLEMMALDPTSLALTQLTSNDVDDTMPTWSGDHARIVFVRRDNAPRHHLYVRDSSGHEQRLTTDGSNCSENPATIDEYNPAWSSTDWIAYVCQTATSVSSIRIVKPDGTEDQEVATGEYLRAPTWSPDGSTLVYISASSDPTVTMTTNTYDLVRLILGGRGPQNLTNTRDITERRPSWGPDGRTIAFVMDHGADGDADNDIFKRVITNATPAIQLTDTPGQFDAPLQDGGPAWSPDGSQIAFIRATDEQPTGFHIWRITAEGSAPEDLMMDRPGLNTNPSWR